MSCNTLSDIGTRKNDFYEKGSRTKVSLYRDLTVLGVLPHFVRAITDLVLSRSLDIRGCKILQLLAPSIHNSTGRGCYFHVLLSPHSIQWKTANHYLFSNVSERKNSWCGPWSFCRFVLILPVDALTNKLVNIVIIINNAGDLRAFPE